MSIGLFGMLAGKHKSEIPINVALDWIWQKSQYNYSTGIRRLYCEYKRVERFPSIRIWFKLTTVSSIDIHFLTRYTFLLSLLRSEF